MTPLGPGPPVAGRRRRYGPLGLVLLASISTAALVPGCIRTDMIRYLDLPPKPVESVELLPAPPQRPYQIVAQLFLEAGSGASFEDLTSEASRRAAALFIQEAGSRYAGTVVSPGTATTTGTVTASPSGAVTGTYVTTTTPGYAAPLYVKRVVVLAITYTAPGPPPAPPR